MQGGEAAGASRRSRSRCSPRRSVHAAAAMRRAARGTRARRARAARPGRRPTRRRARAPATTRGSRSRPASARRCSPTASATRGTSSSRRTATCSSRSRARRRRREAGAGDRQPAPASFVALRDTNGDGRADSVVRVGDASAARASRSHAGWLYVDEGDAHRALRAAAGALAPSGEPEMIVQGLPMERAPRAQLRASTADGALLRERRLGDELVPAAGSHAASRRASTRAPSCRRARGIWRYDANQPSQRFSRRGALRDRHPQRDRHDARRRPAQLWTTQHGRDQLHDNWPKVFTDREYQARELPAEELLQVNAGRRLRLALLLLRSVTQKKRVARAGVRRRRQEGRRAARRRRHRRRRSPATGRR